jgi:hypothetical protein
MPETTLHIGLTHKIPLDKYEMAEVMVNASVKFEKGEKVVLGSADAKAIVIVQHTLIELAAARLQEQEDRLQAEYAARYKRGSSLLGKPPEE